MKRVALGDKEVKKDVIDMALRGVSVAIAPLWGGPTAGGRASDCAFRRRRTTA